MFGYLNVAAIIDPLQRIRLGMRNSRNAKLLNKNSGGHIGATTSINDQVAHFVLDGTPGDKEHFSLTLVTRSVLGM